MKRGKRKPFGADERALLSLRFSPALGKLFRAWGRSGGLREGTSPG
ncbi:hypothetical protein TheveDRAFT_1364 [Thermanaerovibrio velox DSM 12556]|uniref:Uncharacterized protein n=1 Tax=Thermanaerovibrio velox DSM 12556 TaxID=926567 RepID=H0UNY0_9BACT|nr:hypothetical protein [Thermanaerovibrio velox]EHM10483.1 hypothetical protein TheveDRAFT_1364 [Thermanaerovibrio velox DSM 12556]